MKYKTIVNGARRTVEFDPSKMAASIDGRKIDADVAPASSGIYSVLLGAHSMEVTVEKAGDGWLARAVGREYRIEFVDPRSLGRRRAGGLEPEGPQQITAPMPGKIVRVLVTNGQKVEVGQGLLVVEAMKMQNEIRSPKSGIVERLAREGHSVSAGEMLAVVE